MNILKSVSYWGYEGNALLCVCSAENNKTKNHIFEISNLSMTTHW